MKERLEYLIESHLNGSADVREESELKGRLETSEKAREAFIRASLEHQRLRDSLRPRAQPVVGSLFRTTPRWSFAAAAAALLLGTWLLLEYRGGNPSPQPPRLGELRQGELSVLAGVMPPNSGVFHEHRYLASADSEVDLGGTTLHFQDSTLFELVAPPGRDNRPLIRMISGQVLVDVPPSAPGVLLDTPKGRLRDVGTRFEVQVESENGDQAMYRQRPFTGLVAVLVLAGLVEFQPMSSHEVLTLTPDGGQLVLEDDGSLGKLTALEGLVLTRPRNESRSQAASEGTRVEPGTKIETGSRTPGAARIRLNNGTEILVGPKTGLLVVDAATIHLDAGGVEITPGAGVTITLVGPQGNKNQISADSRRYWHIRDGKLDAPDKTPLWVDAFKRERFVESLGTLIATVDGREVPLEMGFHNVTVDIRDGLAQTIIEESFINRTNAAVEGTFYFPLPADASVSGFSVWYGNQKIDGDIVERSRAREIYARLKQEKKDPSLLEWSGGSLFEARLARITGEKKVQIRYTQILKHQGPKLRYDYALRSDMTTRTPLREVNITVNITSGIPLDGVTSPSHPCRVTLGKHAARLEYSARDVRPDRDFTLILEQSQNTAGLALASARRDNEAWFMTSLKVPEAPPGYAATRRPLELVVVFDTSMTMAGENRTIALGVLETLLRSLSPDDRLNLAVADQTTTWAFPTFVPANALKCEEALAFAAARRPLGWSDMDDTFVSIYSRATPATDVIYIGDGFITKGPDLDSAAFTRRVDQVRAGRGTLHAVAVGNNFDSVVMNDLALNSGTFRETRTSKDAPSSAAQLLDDLLKPALSDIRIEINGIETAAVYPSRWPRMRAGSRQVIVGRYDPRRGTSAHVRLSGVFAGEKISSETHLDLATAPSNDLIPRLWAMRHIDHLYRQGAHGETRTRIIELSEDFQIVTPFTSLLVIEDDEEREKYRVEKRLRMRDGEEFFAAARADVNHEVQKQTLQVSRAWRTAFRRDVIRVLNHLGVEALTELFQADVEEAVLRERVSQGGYASRTGGWTGGGGGGTFAGLPLARRGLGQHGGKKPGDGSPEVLKRQLGDGDWSEPTGADLPAILALGEEAEKAGDEVYINDFDVEVAQAAVIADKLVERKSKNRIQSAISFDDESGGLFGLGRPVQTIVAKPNPREGLGEVFPALSEPPLRNSPEEWTAEARALDSRLNRRASLRRVAPVVDLRFERVQFDPRGREATRKNSRVLVGAQSWWQHQMAGEGEARQFDAVGNGRRRVLAEPWLFGRTRPAEPEDLDGWSDPTDYLFTSIGELLNSWTFVGRTDLDGIEIHEFVSRDTPNTRLVVHVDAKLEAITQLVYRTGTRITSMVRFDAFVKFGDNSIASRVRVVNSEGHVSTETRVELSAATDEVLIAALADLDKRENSGLVLPPSPMWSEILERKSAGTLTLHDHFFIAQQRLILGRLDLAEPSLSVLKEHFKNKPGELRFEAAVFANSRRGAEMFGKVRQLALDVASNPGSDDLSRAEELYRLAGNFSASERVNLVEILRPVFERRTKAGNPSRYRQILYSLYTGMNRISEALEVITRTRELEPDNLEAHLSWAWLTAEHRSPDTAIRALRELEDKFTWSDAEMSRLYEFSLTELVSEYRREEVIQEYRRQLNLRPGAITMPSVHRYLSALSTLGRISDLDLSLREYVAYSAVEERTSFQNVALQAALEFLSGNRFYTRWHRVSEENAELFMQAANSFLPRRTALVDYTQAVTRYAITNTRRFRLFLDEADRRVKNEPDMPLYLRARLAAALVSSNHHSASEKELVRKHMQMSVAGWKPTRDLYDDESLLYYISVSGDADETTLCRELVLKAAGSISERRRRTDELYHHLLNTPWNESREKRMWALLPALKCPSPVKELGAETDHLFVWSKLHDLVKRSVEQRTEQILKARTDRATLTGSALKQARNTARESATLGAIEVLKDFASTNPSWRDAALVEELSLLLRIPTRRVEAAAAARTRLRGLVAEISKLSNPGRSSLIEGERLMAMVSFALLAGSDESSLDVWISELAGLPAEFAKRTNAAHHQFMLLVAADRREQAIKLAEVLADSGKIESKLNYGRFAARLEASEGRFEQAAARLKSLEALDLLGPDDHADLNLWNTALNRRDLAENHRQARFEVMEDWAIWNWISNQNQMARGQSTDSSISDEVASAWTVLLRKTDSLNWHLQNLAREMKKTGDFRLYECFASAVKGHSAQRVYDALASCSQIIESISSEAHLDRFMKSLNVFSAGDVTALDRRALDLLTFQAALRAVDQKIGGETWLNRALEVLARTGSSEWAAGEPERLIAFFAGAVSVKHPEVRRVVLEMIEPFARPEFRAGDERARILTALSAMEWNWDRRERALATLESALSVIRSANGGLIPDEHRPAISDYLHRLQALGRTLDAEQVLDDERRLVYPQDVLNWYSNRWYQLVIHAMKNSLPLKDGEGRILYAAAMKKIFADIRSATRVNEAQDRVHRAADLIQEAVGLYTLPDGAKDAMALVHLVRSEVLPRWSWDSSRNFMRRVVQAVEKAAGATTALGVLLDFAEFEPSWVVNTRAGFWNVHAHQLGDLVTRSREGLRDDHMNRVMKVVTREMRADFASLNSNSRVLYHKDYPNFLKDKQNEFSAIARETAEEFTDDADIATYVAQYLAGGLGNFGMAADVMQGAYRRGLLSFEGKSQLRSFLEQAGRSEEVIRLVSEQIQERPKDADLRVSLLKALFRLGRSAEVALALSEMDQALVQNGASAVNDRFLVATALVDINRADRAEVMLSELVREFAEMKDGRLGITWVFLARARASLDQLAGAVDAAAAAWVVAAQSTDERNKAFDLLVTILSGAKDESFNTWLTAYEADAATSGTDSEILRTAVAQRFSTRGDPAAAAGHLEIALALNPANNTLRQELAKVLETSGQRQRLREILWDGAAMNPRDASGWVRLASVFRHLEDSLNAERALTSLVEAAPREAEYRRLLAAERIALKDTDAALAELNTGLRLDPKAISLLLDRAELLKEKGDLAGSQADAARVRGLLQGNPDKNTRQRLELIER